jgi:hypothetical protein
LDKEIATTAAEIAATEAALDAHAGAGTERDVGLTSDDDEVERPHPSPVMKPPPPLPAQSEVVKDAFDRPLDSFVQEAAQANRWGNKRLAGQRRTRSAPKSQAPFLQRRPPLPPPPPAPPPGYEKEVKTGKNRAGVRTIFGPQASAAPLPRRVRSRSLQRRPAKPVTLRPGYAAKSGQPPIRGSVGIVSGEEVRRMKDDGYGSAWAEPQPPPRKKTRRAQRQAAEVGGETRKGQRTATEPAAGAKAAAAERVPSYSYSYSRSPTPTRMVVLKKEITKKFKKQEGTASSTAPLPVMIPNDHPALQDAIKVAAEALSARKDAMQGLLQGRL